MTSFTTEEQNMICLYDPGSREGLIHELREMQKDLYPDEDDLKALSRSVIKKLKRMTDDEYFELVKQLSPFYPLDDYSFLDEDSAYAWSDEPDYDDIDPDEDFD